MAAYGALVSVMQIMDQLHHHPHPPISLHKEQAESLAANVSFLQEFLEGYNPRVSYTSEADPLESRIAEAAYAAEDVIENYIVDQIQARSVNHDGGRISATEFYQGLEKVIEEMDLIKVEVTEKKMQGVQIIKKQSTTEAASLRSSSTAHKVTTTVGLDEVLNEMLEKIARGPRVRQIIPIVGMGGLGKTTLARNIYENQLVKEHFDIRAWSTISQLHNARKILTEILDQVGLDNDGVDLSDGELGLKLYKHLMGKRYLIVMDDMWRIEAWDKVRSFFPENGNGSRVVVTTRLSNLASMFDYSDGLDMKFMDETTSWNLFCRTVFGDDFCPPELEDIGKKIVEGCRGLPLSIVVVGGLLSKSEATRENWEVVEENLSSVVNLEGDGSCLQILYMSYNNLPINLKPSFLYMGVFPEDEEIQVYFLIQLMVAEGFIKPVDGKRLEEVGEEHLEELVNRNLVLVGKRDHLGKLESIKVHDLVRDLALREGEKDKFVYWLKQNKSSGDRDISQGMTSSLRRITNWTKEESITSSVEVLESLEGAAGTSLVRSLVGEYHAGILSLPSFGLLRVCMIGAKEESSDDEEESSDVEEENRDDEEESSDDEEENRDDEEENRDDEYYEIFIRLLNLRFLFIVAAGHLLPKIPSYLWNLQILILVYVDKEYVLEIWKMPLLRLIVIDDHVPICLSNPPPDEEVIVLENLHTLYAVRNLKLSEEVLKRIPNIRLLSLCYEEEEDKEKKGNYYYLKNLHCLSKLQDLCLNVHQWDSPSVQELNLPYSLKKLKLEGTKLPWEEMASKIGCLPLLQGLILGNDSCVGLEWETVEGQFSSLKYLEIRECEYLEQWVTEDSTHFPRLEQLVLNRLTSLREIPLNIGDISTLRSIEVNHCSDSAVESARRIQEEQEEYDNQLLQIRVNWRSIQSDEEF